MADLSDQAKEALLTIFIGQHVNQAGILQSESSCKNYSAELISEGFIKINSFYRFNQFITTNKGSDLASSIIRKRIEDRENQIRTEFKGIPSKVYRFFC